MSIQHRTVHETTWRKDNTPGSIQKDDKHHWFTCIRQILSLSTRRRMNSNIFDNFTKTYLSKISSKRRITFQNTMANNTLSNAISGHFRLFNQLSCAKIASGLNLIRLSDEHTLVSTLTFFHSNQCYKPKPVHENYILYNLKGFCSIV